MMDGTVGGYEEVDFCPNTSRVCTMSRIQENNLHRKVATCGHALISAAVVRSVARIWVGECGFGASLWTSVQVLRRTGAR